MTIIDMAWPTSAAVRADSASDGTSLKLPAAARGAAGTMETVILWKRNSG
jgi:hypothetical protein